MKKHRVQLSQEERSELEKLTRSGTIAVRTFKRIRILLLSDEGEYGPSKTNQEIAEIVEVSPITVSRIRKRFVEEGLEQALHDKPKSGAPRTFGGDVRAKITALACSDPPEGYAKWSLRLLADKMVELEYVDSISHMTIQEVLKKTNCSLT
jgi:transposase